MMRRTFLAALLVITVTSCRMERSIAPREPASAAEVERIARAFEAVVVASTDAWFPAGLPGDVEAIRLLYTDDIVHHDETFDAHIVGIEDVMEMASNFVNFPMEAEVTARFIGAEDGLALEEMWGLSLRGHQFTRDDPLLEVDLLETRDGLISHWTLFYGLNSIDSFKAADTPSTDEARTLLASYASLWSSGDLSMVGELYALNAIREDTIFGERQEGREAVTSFADSFFASYPGAEWDLLVPFGDGTEDDPATGGVFAITVGGAGEETCEVQAAVLVETSEDHIVHESVYYDADSLIACGWAR